MQKKYPEADIYMIGTSFGSNYLTRYLLRNPKNKIKGYVGLGTPFDVPVVMNEMSPVYQKFFIKRYSEIICSHSMMTHWERIGLLQLSEMMKAETLPDFYTKILPLTGLSSI